MAHNHKVAGSSPAPRNNPPKTTDSLKVAYSLPKPDGSKMVDKMERHQKGIKSLNGEIRQQESPVRNGRVFFGIFKIYHIFELLIIVDMPTNNNTKPKFNVGCAIMMVLGITWLLTYILSDKKEVDYKSSNHDTLNRQKNYGIVNISDKEDSAKVNKILKGFFQRRDDFEGITWYYDKNTSRSLAYTGMYIYLGRKNNHVWPVIRIQYHSDDWLFIRTCTLKSGKIKYNLSFAENNRDNDENGVYEWCDFTDDLDVNTFANSIILNNTNTIRLNGDQYYHDINVTSRMRKSLDNVWSAYNKYNLR